MDVSESEALEEDGISIQEKKKVERLKLLGVVPIPGTKKMYTEDIEKEKLDRRKQMAHLPAWESYRKSSGKL